MAPVDGIDAPLAELEFLARSPNRVRVLDALTRGPITRRDLEADADVTRATLGRILDDFEDRGWARAAGREYETTPLGAYVAREVRAALERFAPVPALNQVARWFPDEGFGFDLGHLAGATVVTTSRRDPLAPTTHIASRIRGADRVRLVTYAVLPDVVDACWRGAVEDGLELESVLDRRAIAGFAADDDLGERAMTLAGAETTAVFVTVDDVPSTVFVVDDHALLCLSGGEGAPLAVVETDDETVREWADALVDDHVAAADRLDPAAFTG